MSLHKHSSFCTNLTLVELKATYCSETLTYYEFCMFAVLVRKLNTAYQTYSIEQVDQLSKEQFILIQASKLQYINNSTKFKNNGILMSYQTLILSIQATVLQSKIVFSLFQFMTLIVNGSSANQLGEHRSNTLSNCNLFTYYHILLITIYYI